MKIGVLEEFGLSHGQVSTQLQAGLPNLANSDRTPSENSHNNNNKSNNDNPPPSWHGDGTGSNDSSRQGGLLRPLSGNLGRAVNVDRGPGNGGARGEGMVDSWICSSD